MQKFISIILLFIIALNLSGCVYRNKCGYSTSYWDDKEYYYDSQGNYKEVCPDNFIYRDEYIPNNELLEDF